MLEREEEEEEEERKEGRKEEEEEEEEERKEGGRRRRRSLHWSTLRQKRRPLSYCSLPGFLSYHTGNTAPAWTPLYPTCTEYITPVTHHLPRIYHTRYTPPSQNIPQNDTPITPSSHLLHNTCTECLTPITQHLHKVYHTHYTHITPITQHLHRAYHSQPVTQHLHRLHHTCTKYITPNTQHQRQSMSHPSYHTTPAQIISHPLNAVYHTIPITLYTLT